MSEAIDPSEYSAMQGDNEMPQEYVEFAKFVVEDKKIPKDVKKEFWGFINKETVLSRTDHDDRRRSENRYAIIRNFMLMAEPYYKIDIHKLKEFQNIQQRNTIEVSRSLGGFERQALTTQIRQVITNRGREDQNKSGFFEGVKSKLGFGKKEEGVIVGQ